MKTSLSQPARYLILLIATALALFSIGSLNRIGETPGMAGWYIFYSFAMLIESAILLFCFFNLKWLWCINREGGGICPSILAG